jgi:phosphoglycerate dehydrogenase-like enzyme
MGNVKPDFLKLCPRLKWLQLKSAGTNGYVEGQVKETALLTCASGSYGLAVSEHMVALTFELMKKLHLYRDEQAKCRWRDRGEVKSVQGAVVLVIGMGDIGRNYARRMKALGSYVIGVCTHSYQKPDFLDELHLSEKIDELLPRADVAALIVPGTKDTVKLIGCSQLAKMKKGAVIINAGRGAVLDTEAVCDALESGALGGAGLDVTDPEPLPPEHRLWKLENAVITPHISGGNHLPVIAQNILNLFLENSRRFVKGEKLKSLVDFRTGYRVPED